MDSQGQTTDEGQEGKHKLSKEERRKEELRTMLARMLTKDYVIEQLSAWEDCIDPSSFDLNDFALSGPLYDRFLDRLYEHRREVKASIPGRSACCFRSPSSDLDAGHPSLLRLVFHGTPDQNMASILLVGMLPSKRRRDPQCDWFAYDPAYSKGYTLCNESGLVPGERLLVFLVLPVKKAVIGNSKMEQVLTMTSASYQLPIGTVEFVKPPQTQT